MKKKFFYFNPTISIFLSNIILKFNIFNLNTKKNIFYLYFKSKNVLKFFKIKLSFSIKNKFIFLNFLDLHTKFRIEFLNGIYYWINKLKVKIYSGIFSNLPGNFFYLSTLIFYNSFISNAKYKNSLIKFKIFIIIILKKKIFKTFSNLNELYKLIYNKIKIIIQIINKKFLNLKKKYLIISIITTFYLIILNVLFIINLLLKLIFFFNSIINYLNLYFKFNLLSFIILIIILFIIYYTIKFIIPYLSKKSPIKNFNSKIIKLLSKLYFIYNYINSLFSLKTILIIKTLFVFFNKIIFLIFMPFGIDFYPNLLSVLYNIFFNNCFWNENIFINYEQQILKFSNNIVEADPDPDQNNNNNNNNSNSILQNNQNSNENNNFINFNLLSDQEKKNYIQNQMIIKGIYPMEETVNSLAESTSYYTSGSQQEVENYVSINLDIISNAEKVSEINSSYNYSQNSFLNTSEAEENDIQQAIKLSIEDLQRNRYEWESHAESSNTNKTVVKNDNFNLSNNTIVEDEDEDEELQRALALSLSDSRSNSPNIDQLSNSNLNNNINEVDVKGKSKQN